MEAVSTGKSGLKTVAEVGIIGTLSVAVWEFAMKPLGRKVKKVIERKKAAKKQNDSVEDDADLDDIPEID